MHRNETELFMRLILICLALTASPLAIAMGPAERADALNQGERLLQPFKQQLMGALKRGLEKGPAEAIETCRIEAPAIPGDVAPPGVELGRTSHKLRNPANAPNAWQQDYLQYYRAHEDDSPRVKSLPNGRVAYVEPIRMKPLCTTCHGKAVPDSVHSRLQALYPDDQATGFEIGDFRGIFWATWQSSETPQKAAE
jgi:hypothetical protein